MTWPTAFTNNFNPNPSVEAGTAGYSALLGTEQLSQDTLAHTGSRSLLVTTPGSVPGEGISAPAGTVLASATGSATLYVYGETGVLTVQALQNPGGQVLGTTQVTLDGQQWQRAELDGLAMTATDTFYLVVYTTTTQALTWWVDSVQYEPDSPAHPYVDGDSAYGAWTGTPEASPSFQRYQNPASADGGMVLEGTITIIARGEVFAISGPVTGMMDMSGDQHVMAVTSGTRTVIAPAIDPGIAGLPWEISGGGSISVLVVAPGPAFRDFAVYTSADPDPAMTLIGWNNAGTLDAAETATSYTQVFGTFSPPHRQLDSGGHARWQSAAYMAAGFRIASQGTWASATPNTVNFTDVQVEKAQGLSGQVPSAYQLPRSLSTVIRPTRLNYVPNPSFQVTGGNWDEFWTAIGGVTLTQVTGTKSSFSMQVSVPAAGDGVYITVPDLICGDTFIASAYTTAVSANINDITMSVAGTSVSSAQADATYNAGTYGTGPYGGSFNPASALPTTGIYRPSATFTAPSSTVVLGFVPTAITGATYPLVFTIDCVMVEPGEVLNPYGDGSTSGWGWEAGGTPGLTRSYWYERESVAVNAISNVLQQHIPLGTTAYAPQYFVPPSQ